MPNYYDRLSKLDIISPQVISTKEKNIEIKNIDNLNEKITTLNSYTREQKDLAKKTNEILVSINKNVKANKYARV